MFRAVQWVTAPPAATPQERARRVVTNPAPNSRVAYRVGHVQQEPRGRGLQDNVCRVAPFLFSQYIASML